MSDLAASPVNLQAPAPRHRSLLLVSVTLAMFMIELDLTIVTIALPSMQHALGFSPTGLQWIIDAYLLFFGGFLLLAGRLGDLLGRKALFLGAMVLFADGSALNAAAPSAAALVAGRSMQGLAGAMLSPTALALLTETFTDAKERARAMGVWTAAQTGSVALGLMLGGVITSELSWRWIFVINLPIAAIAFLSAAVSLPRSPRRHTGFDLPGAVTVTAGLVLLVYVLSEGQSWGWASARTIGLLAAGAVLLAMFPGIERSRPSPLVRLGIFKNRALAVANVGFLLSSAAMYGSFYFTTLYVQDILGYSPLHAGLALLPLTAGVLTGAALAQVLLSRLGARVTALAGSAMSALGMVLLMRTGPAGDYPATLLPGLLVLAIGLGLAMVPFTLLATSGVAQHESGIASGIYTASSYLGGAIGLAILATTAAAVTPHSPSHTALLHGYHVSYLLAAVLLAIAMPLLWLLSP